MGNKGDRPAFCFIKKGESIYFVTHTKLRLYNKRQDPLNLHIRVRFSPMINKTYTLGQS